MQNSSEMIKFLPNHFSFLLPNYEKKIRMKGSKLTYKELEEKVSLLESQLDQLNAKTRESELGYDLIDKVYHLLIKFFPIPMGIYSPEGKIEYLNDKATEVFGYTIKDIPNQEYWWKKAYPDKKYRKEVMLKWQKLTDEAHNSQSDIQPAEFTITCKNGQKLSTTIYGREIADKFLIVINDITALKNAKEAIRFHEQELEQKNTELLKSNKKIQKINIKLTKAKKRAEESDRLKSAFLSNMSHEIRTPLNAIMGFSEFLEQHVLPENKRKLYSKIIHQRGNDLLKIINDILDISKIEAGQLYLYEKETDLNMMMDEIFQFFTARNQFKTNETVELRLINPTSCKDAHIIADDTRLKQIFINLIENSLKFTKSGFIELGCQLAPRNEMLFYVKDTGIGISKSKFHFIFKRFSQAMDPYKSIEYGGTGLGLSICKGLVDLMKGSIWFESAEKKGTTFYFTIPYVPADDHPETVAKTVKNNYNWQGKIILLVEDDLWSVAYLDEVLAFTAVTVKKATNGKQALKLFGSSPAPDIVLMDIQLPDIDGLQLTALMKKKNPEQIIIAQTAFASENDRALCMEAGCADYISKPIEQSTLLEIIDKYMVC